MEAQKPRVLIAEDDKDCARGLAVMLASHFDVSVRHSAREALSSVHVSSPDLLMLDFQLPDMDGLRIVELIREQRGFPIPAILMSAVCRREHACSQAGVDAFLEKPFDRAFALGLIQRLLGMP